MHGLNAPLETPAPVRWLLQNVRIAQVLLRTKARMQSEAGSAVGNDRIARQMRTNHIRGGLLPREKGAKSAAAASAGDERRRPFAWRMQMPLPLRGGLVIKRAMHPKGGLRRGREAGLPLYVRYDALHGQGQNEKIADSHHARFSFSTTQRGAVPAKAAATRWRRRDDDPE